MGEKITLRAEYDAKRRGWFAANLRILKQFQGCDDCGTHEGWLLHHHLDPSTKKCNVAHMAGSSLKSFFDEIAKCTVRCSPCHAKAEVRK